MINLKTLFITLKHEEEKRLVREDEAVCDQVTQLFIMNKISKNMWKCPQVSFSPIKSVLNL